MKSFRLGVLAKVLHILLSCMQLSEAQDVSNAVCKWNRSTSTCQQDQQGLIDLLTEAGEAHTFALFMTCQYVSDKYQCNNLSTCVWENRACRISSKKLVTQINSCFYTDTQLSIFYTDGFITRQKYDSIIPCKNELISISNSATWINEDSMNPAWSCRQVVGTFSYDTNTCRLMAEALLCGDTGRAQGCEWAFSINNQANQFVSDLRYVMNVSQQDVSLQLQHIERYLDIRAGNLEEYFRCSQKDLQECEELPPLPSPPPSPPPPPPPQNNNTSRLSSKEILICLVLSLFFVYFCCPILIVFGVRQARATANERRQAQNLELRSVNVTSQNAAQNQVAQIQTAEIIAALPPLEYMDDGDNRSEQVCVICLEGLKEGEISTVLPCAHWFHKNCMDQWINNKGSSVTCPLCNHPVQQQNNQL